MLKDINYMTSYSKSNNDNIATDFYIPSLSVSKRYDRATGYFGSTIYIIAWGGLKEFVKNGGKIRIICSPYLAEHDQEAIEIGINSKKEESAIDEFKQELSQLFCKDALTAPEKVLAGLIAEDVLQIKLAIGKEDPNRLFHDKVGVFHDEKDSVAFRGSINETYKGLSNDGNFESLDVFTSWGYPSDVERLRKIELEFERIWNSKNSNIKVVDIPSDIKDIIKRKATNKTYWETALDEVITSIDEAKTWSADKRINGKRPRQHQLDSLKHWEANGRRGILEHATGSGKTFTAICAIRKCLEEGAPVLVLVPSAGLLTQWKIEMEAILTDIHVNYLLCGDGHNDWKTDKYLEAFLSPISNGRNRVTIAVMDTATSFQFLRRLKNITNMLVVADEVHRMGGIVKRKFFKVKAAYRLALSATPKRYNDPEGTKCIFDYFGGIIPPVYSLKDAINDNVLCHYFYTPNVVELTETEQKEWDNLSNRISKEYAIMSSRKQQDDIINNQFIKSLLIKRARIVKNAEKKIHLATTLIRQKYREGERWIVYCDNQVQMRNVLSNLLNIKIRAYEFHSELTDDVKKNTITYFKQIGGVIVSIKCLDEGIDIPNATHALILASSQNPREFIQRRGRVLRKSPNKHFAYLYDAIVLPKGFSRTDPYTKMVETELARAIEFGEMSDDKKCITDLKLIAIDNNVNYEKIALGYEDD